LGHLGDNTHPEVRAVIEDAAARQAEAPAAKFKVAPVTR
jgi:hypothetical protein